MSKQVFLSYAWGDDTPQGKERREVVERLCERLCAWGYEVVRDKDHMRYGDLISDFMKRIGDADRVVVILSEKYLRSVYCMTELHGVFTQSRAEKEDFLRRIVPLTLADARIDGPRHRAGHARHWKAEKEEWRSYAADGSLAANDYRLLQKMDHWATDVPEMLSHIADTLHPMGFEAIVAGDFAAVKQRLERGT